MQSSGALVDKQPAVGHSGRLLDRLGDDHFHNRSAPGQPNSSIGGDFENEEKRYDRQVVVQGLSPTDLHPRQQTQRPRRLLGVHLRRQACH